MPQEKLKKAIGDKILGKIGLLCNRLFVKNIASDSL